MSEKGLRCALPISKPTIASNACVLEVSVEPETNSISPPSSKISRRWQTTFGVRRRTCPPPTRPEGKSSRPGSHSARPRPQKIAPRKCQLGARHALCRFFQQHRPEADRTLRSDRGPDLTHCGHPAL